MSEEMVTDEIVIFDLKDFFLSTLLAIGVGFVLTVVRVHLKSSKESMDE